MEELEKKGYITNSHAKIVGGESAFSGGTVVGNAYAGTGSGGGTIVGDTSGTKKKTTTKGKSGSSSGDGKNKSSSSDKKWDKFSKWLEKFFDWIEVKLDRLSSITDKWTTAAENAVTLSAKATNYSKAINATKDELNANGSASDKYLKQAQKVGTKAAKVSGKDGITQKWVNGIMAKLQDGSLDITKYGGKKKEVIDDIQEWYDKSLEASEAVSDLTDNLQDLYTELENLANTEAEETADKLNDKLDILSDRIDLLASASDKNANLAEQNKLAKQTLDAYNTALSKTTSSLESAKKDVKNLGNSSLTNAVNTGQKIEIQDSWSTAWKDAVAKYNASLEANQTAITNAEKANVEYYTTIQKNAVQMMDNIASEYERVQARISQASTEIENAMNLNEAKGYRTSENYYKGMMDAEQKNIASMQEERTRLNNELKNKLNSGKITYGTDDYWGQVDKINDVTNSIAESRTKIQEWQNDINELDWSNFERLQELNSDITEEIEFLIDELSRVDLTDKDTGAFTDEGKAAMSLYASSYNVNKEQINQYQKELDEWYEKLKEDPFNENIIDHIQELEESQRDYVSALQDTKYAMIDLAKQGFEAQKDYLQDTIDKYKDLMDTQEDAYDYQKTINDAVKEINDIQKQIGILSGDTSEENRARLQQLNVQLKDKQTSLEDTQRQKLTSDINDMFDDLMDNYSDYVDDLIDALDEDENFAKLIDAVNVGLDDTQTIIAKLAESFGIDLSDELSSILNGNNIGESTQKVTSGIEKEQQDIISKSNSNASNEVNSINTTNESEEADRKASYDSGVANRTNNAIEQAQQQASQSAEAQRLAEEQARLAADEKAEKDRADFLTALDYIGSHFYKPKSGTKASDIKNATKKKIFEKTKDRTVTVENLNALAGLLGVSSSGLYNRLNELGVFKAIGKSGIITTIAQFAKGSKNITKPTLALINEEGQEITYDKSQGAILTSLNPGDKVYTAKQAQVLYDLSKGDYSSMIPYMHTSTPQMISSTSGDVSVAIGDINLQGVQTPRELAYAIKDVVKNDRTVRGLLKDVTVNELMPNHNSLSMNKW